MLLSFSLTLQDFTHALVASLLGCVPDRGETFRSLVWCKQQCGECTLHSCHSEPRKWELCMASCHPRQRGSSGCTGDCMTQYFLHFLSQFWFCLQALLDICMSCLACGLCDQQAWSWTELQRSRVLSCRSGCTGTVPGLWRTTGPLGAAGLRDCWPIWWMGPIAETPPCGFSPQPKIQDASTLPVSSGQVKGASSSPQIVINAQENPTEPFYPFKNHALTPSFPLAWPQFPRLLRSAPSNQECAWDLPQEPSTSSCPVFVFHVDVYLPSSPSTHQSGFKGCSDSLFLHLRLISQPRSTWCSPPKCFINIIFINSCK